MRTIMNLREICDWRMVPTGLLCLACALPESTLSPPCNLLEQDPELRPGPRSFFYLASGPTQFLQLCVRAHAVSSTLRPGPRSFFNFASGPTQFLQLCVRAQSCVHAKTQFPPGFPPLECSANKHAENPSTNIFVK